ncbi:MAG: hypothetical protein QXD64_08820, partial [Thermoplasmata archaeon]
EYIQKVKPFVKALINKFWNVDPDAYRRILVYQVDNEMNHEIYSWVFGMLFRFGHHPWWDRSWETTLLVGGSNAIREAETEMKVYQKIGKTTLICINPSYDIIANGGNTVEGISQGYDGLKQYLKYVLDDTGSKVDLIGLDYYPGTWAATSESDLKEIVRLLCEDFGLQSAYKKKVVVTETGFSTHERSWTDQKNYYQTLTRLIKEYYHGAGRSKGFCGVIWYEFTSDDIATNDDWSPHESYFGTTRMNLDGTIAETKDVWVWLKSFLSP